MLVESRGLFIRDMSRRCCSPQGETLHRTFAGLSKVWGKVWGKGLLGFLGETSPAGFDAEIGQVGLTACWRRTAGRLVLPVRPGSTLFAKAAAAHPRGATGCKLSTRACENES